MKKVGREKGSKIVDSTNQPNLTQLLDFHPQGRGLRERRREHRRKLRSARARQRERERER